jgi:hypothetical protein
MDMKFKVSSSQHSRTNSLYINIVIIIYIYILFNYIIYTIVYVKYNIILYLIQFFVLIFS